MNYVVDYLRRINEPLTVQNYLGLAYWGEVRSLAELEADCPEDFAEVSDLIEEGVLTVTTGEQER